MNSQLRLLLIPILLGLQTTSTAQERPPSKPSFTITITCPVSETRVGSPVPLHLALTNTSDHEISFYGNVVNGPVFRNVRLRQMDIQVRDSSGKLVPESEYGKTAHARSLDRAPEVPDPSRPGKPPVTSDSRGVTSAMDPGQTLSEEADLNKEFDFSEPGEYTVQALRKDGDTGRNVLSNKITITITK